MYSYLVKEIHVLTENVSQIILQTDEAQRLSFEAGQYIEVIHPDQTTSPLSIACAPNEKSLLEFHLSHPPHNKKALELLQIAKQAKKWQLRGPFGACTLASFQLNKPLLFLTRDTGFAPVKAMLDALIPLQPKEPIHLYWLMPKPTDIYLPRLLESWQKQLSQFKFTLIYECDFLEKQTAHSSILQNIILRDHPHLSHYQIYASGPRVLIETAYKVFQEKGLPSDMFYSDILNVAKKD